MKKILLDKTLNKYKANLHCHSTVSDGRLTPEELKSYYMENGYSIIAYTDHDIMIAHDELNDERFLALHGYEMEFDEGGSYGADRKTCHICLIQRDPTDMRQICWHRSKYVHGISRNYLHLIQFDNSLPDFERYYTPECISEVMRCGRENGFFVTYNHPTWSLEMYEDYMKFDGMHAMEIFNYSCYVDGYEEYNARVYDDMLRGGKEIYCIAADDNHNGYPLDSKYNDSLGGFTVIFSESLSYRSVTDALFDGNFYASQGPEIYSLTYEDGKVHIECSPAQRIIITTNSRGFEEIRNKNTGADELLTEADYNLSKTDKYFRITVFDKSGKIANTNAYRIEALIK